MLNTMYESLVLLIGWCVHWTVCLTGLCLLIPLTRSKKIQINNRIQQFLQEIDTACHMQCSHNRFTGVPSIPWNRVPHVLVHFTAGVCL